MSLSEQRRAQLGAIVDELIPAGSGMPSASEAGVGGPTTWPVTRRAIALHSRSPPGPTPGSATSESSASSAAAAWGSSTRPSNCRWGAGWR